MKKYARLFGFIPVLLIGAALQLLLIQADSIDTPERAALEFMEAYYGINAAMSERLCKASISDGERNFVEEHIKKIEIDADERGYAANYMRHRLFDVETYAKIKNTENVEIRIKADKYRCARAVYPYIARIFGMGKVEKIDRKLNLIKKDGKWKVCDFVL